MARKTAAAGDTVTIGCKLPTGLHIKHAEMGIDIKLHGKHSPYAHSGYGITRNVDALMWSRVAVAFPDAPWLKSEAVFAVGDPQSAADRATDQKDVRVGFEAIDPNAPGSGVRGMIQPDGAPDNGPGR